MRVFGIICECNPFHQGHSILIDKAKELGADSVIAVMSGDFVQRGEPAFLSKFQRAGELGDAGVSLVFELPVRYALSSAHEFAKAGVALLAATGVVDTILFGSECGNIKKLEDAASLGSRQDVKERIEELTTEGYSWPAAREKAFCELGDEGVTISSPNDTLAVEYISAVKEGGYDIKYMTVKREENTGTAHSVREKYAKGENVSSLISEAALRELEAGNTPDADAFNRVALYKLRTMSAEEFSMLPDINGGLDRRLYAASRTAGSMEELYEAVKTKRYTMSRCKRTALRGIIGIANGRIAPPYLRLMAIGKGGKEILCEMKERATLPLSSSIRELSGLSADTGIVSDEEIRATDLWNTIKKVPSPLFEDYTGKLYVNDLQL